MGTPRWSASCSKKKKKSSSSTLWESSTSCFLSLVLLILLLPTATLPARTRGPAKRGSGYQITPKACTVNRTKGVCMFVWECIRHEGEHLGMCMDSFMFGSCCLLPGDVTVPTVAADTSPAASSAASAVLSLQQQQPPPHHHRPGGPNHPNSIHSRPSTKRPPPTTPTYVSSTINNNPSTTPSPIITTTPTVAVSKITERPLPPESTPAADRTTSSTWLTGSSTDPNFVTRPKPTTSFQHITSWSGPPIRPRPPDLMSGSLNAQRPRPQKPGSPGYVTKKPSSAGGFTSNFITSSSTTKHPSKPNPSGDTIDFVTVTRPPTKQPPAILDFVHLPTKRPTTVQVVRPISTTSTTTTTSLRPPTTTSIIYTTTSTRPPSKRPPTYAPPSSTRPPSSPRPPPPPPPPSPTTTIMTSSTTSSSSTTTSSTSQGPQARKVCGVPPLFPRPEQRIVGGSTAVFGGYPWQVSVRRTSFFGFSSTHRCGGAVLNENWIATAGHCVDDLLTSQIRIRVGEYDFSSAGEPIAHEERGVLRKLVHPRYNFFTYEYDLALVQLDRPLQFAPHIAPICLPGNDDLLVGETAIVTGWGRLSEGGTLPSILQEVSVPIVSNEKCKSMFLKAGRHEHIPDIFLCAGYDDGGRDSCQGDSGGPLQVRGKDGRYFLAGIISWGIGCAESNLPGVCTRISKFVDWIMENVT